MAKEYAYYIEGNRIGIVEKDTAFDNNVDSKEYGPGVGRAMWKSPQSSVTDGLEIKYSYAPYYNINHGTAVTLSAATATPTGSDKYLKTFYSTAYEPLGENYLSIIYENADATSVYIAGKYLLIKDNPFFNGIHKILNVTFSTDTLILLETEIPSQFLEDSEDLGNDDFRAEIHLGTVYPYVEHINSDTENFKLDLPAYLQHALICYVKARIAEDAGNLEYKEYMMREYKKHIETYESSLVKGPRMISSGHHAIR